MSLEGGPGPDMQHMLAANPNADAQLRDMATSTAVMERPADDLVVAEQAPVPSLLNPEEVAGALGDIRDLHSTNPSVKAQALEKHGFNPDEHDEAQFVGRKYTELTGKVVGHAEAKQAAAVNNGNPFAKIDDEKRSQLLEAAQKEAAAERAEQGIIEPTTFSGHEVRGQHLTDLGKSLDAEEADLKATDIATTLREQQSSDGTDDEEDEFAHMRPDAPAPHDPDLADVQKNGMTMNKSAATTPESEEAKSQVSDFMNAADEKHQSDKDVAKSQVDDFMKAADETHQAKQDLAGQQVDDFLQTTDYNYQSAKAEADPAQKFMDNASSVDNSDFEADAETKDKVANFLEASSPQLSTDEAETPEGDHEESEEDEDDLELAEFLTIPQDVDEDLEDMLDEEASEETRREKWSRRFGNARKRAGEASIWTGGKLAQALGVGFEKAGKVGRVIAEKTDQFWNKSEKSQRNRNVVMGVGAAAVGVGLGILVYKVTHGEVNMTPKGEFIQDWNEKFKTPEERKVAKEAWNSYFRDLVPNFKAGNPVLEGGVTYENNPALYDQIMNERINEMINGANDVVGAVT